MRIGIVTGDNSDDGAVVEQLRRLRPADDVVVHRPDPEADADPAALDGCDAVYVLDARGALAEHRYPLYRRLFRTLAPLKDRLVPALGTLQFLWSKAELLRLMDAHGVPHLPTLILERPAAAAGEADLRAALDRMVAWIGTLRPAPRWIVTKPSHSTNCQDVQDWDLDWIAGTDPAGAARLVDYLRRLFEEQGKPYVLVQPRIYALRYGREYRHVFIDGAFHACALTAWKRVPRTDDEWTCVPRRMEDAAVLRQTVPLAERLVSLLPPDSALYRVDLFRHRGRWCVTEVEAVDAGTYGDETVPEPLARALLARHPPPEADAPSPFAVLPVDDDAPGVALSGDRWAALAKHLHGALRRSRTGDGRRKTSG
jgi:hypothetical protein